MHKVRSWGKISRRKSSGNEEDILFELCCAGPNRFKAAKNAVHTPGSFSRPVFLNKGAEPQTVKQCVSRAVAASLVGAGATPSCCVPKCGQRDSASGRGCDALCDGGFWSLAGGDCVALCDGVPQPSAASGRDCDASRAGELRSIAASGGDCVAPGEGELQLSPASGDAQLRLSAASGRHLFVLSLVVHVVLVVHA